jgi:lipid-A-disaccharide synthase-like uncharacterized protein
MIHDLSYFLILTDSFHYLKDWDPWKFVGWAGNLAFFSRFIVQWSATESKRQVVIPAAFWWLSISGSMILLSYSIHRGDSVFIAGQAFSWIPYVRNLYFHIKNKKQQLQCPACKMQNNPSHKFCSNCGTRFI